MQFDENDRIIWPESDAEIIAMLRAASDLWIDVLTSAPLPVDADEATFLAALRHRNLAGLELGRRMGWWPDVTPNGPVAPPMVVKAADFEGKTMAHVMAQVGIFKSVGEARRNGWDKPVTTGVFKVGKNRPVEVR